MGLFSKAKGSLIGAALAPFTGGLSLIGGALYDYNNMQKQAVNKQNQLNQQQAQLQNQLALHNWDLANVYNSPKEQMARLASAGLNPNLVYGSGNVTGNTTGVPDASSVGSQTAFNSADSIVKTLPILQGFANLRNTNSQNELLNYQMGQTQAQTDSLRAGIAQTNAQVAHLGVQDDVMRHNLKIAQETGMPVGDVPSIWNVAGQELSGLRKDPWNILERLSLPGAGLGRSISQKISNFFKN